MEQYGTVLENRDGRARVLVRRTEACAHCGACELGSRAEQVVELPNPEGYPPGTQVRLIVPPGEVAKASFFVYVVPLAALVAGLVAGEMLGRWRGERSDLVTAAFGAGFLALAYLWLRRRDRRRPVCGSPVLAAVATDFQQENGAGEEK